MHSDMTRMGGIIHTAREAKGLTQSALADKIGASVRTVIDVEKDKRNPTYEIFYKIVHVLDISADLVFWPDKVSYTLEQDQFIRELLASDAREQRIVMATLRNLLHELRRENEDAE